MLKKWRFSWYASTLGVVNTSERGEVRGRGKESEYGAKYVYTCM
jgi:hypothetical protein